MRFRNDCYLSIGAGGRGLELEPMEDNGLLSIARRAGDRSARSLEKKYGLVAGADHGILRVSCTYLGEEKPGQEGVYEKDPDRNYVFVCLGRRLLSLWCW